MSRIDIDKFFRDQFLEHEKNSASYSPDRWKNFEQLLDKKTGKNKSNRSGFSLNNLLFFMSSFLIVMLIPLLFLHSDTVKKSDANPEKNVITAKNISITADKKTAAGKNNNKSSENKTIDNTSETGSLNYGAQIKNTNTENAVQSGIDNVDLLSEIRTLKTQENEMSLIVPVKTTVLKDTSALIFASLNSAKTKKEIKQNDTIITTKKGKIKRSKILLPHFYYNGF